MMTNGDAPPWEEEAMVQRMNKSIDREVQCERRYKQMTPEEEKAFRRECEEHQRQKYEEQQAKERQGRLEKVTSRMGPRYAPERVSLSNYQVKHRGQRETLDAVKAYAARLQEVVKTGENLILYGTPGTGKDHMLASLLHLVTGTHNRHAYWIDGATFYQMHRPNPGGVQLVMDKQAIPHAAVFAISDPCPPGELSDFCVATLFAVVDERYREMKPTWLTMNARDEAEMKTRLTVPIYDRLRENALILPCFWHSFRGSK